VENLEVQAKKIASARSGKERQEIETQFQGTTCFGGGGSTTPRSTMLTERRFIA